MPTKLAEKIIRIVPSFVIGLIYMTMYVMIVMGTVYVISFMISLFSTTARDVEFIMTRLGGYCVTGLLFFAIVLVFFQLTKWPLDIRKKL